MRSPSRATASRRITAARRRRTTATRDALGVELGSRWTAMRIGRDLRAGRHGELSLLGADERRAGEGRRRRADRDGDARRRTAGSTRWCSPRRGLPASTRSTGSAARRRSPRSPMAPRRSRPVVKIVGPGNAFVAAAKRQVFGQVGIDMIAGPSEVLVVADRDNDPAWIAADLLAQAEHDAAAQAILITDDSALGAAVEVGCRAAARDAAARRDRARELARFRRDHPRRRISREAPAADRPHRAGASRARGRRPRGAAAARVRNAGAIFLGRHTPEVIGDYVGRLEPRAADGALGALLLRPFGARLHEAHVAPEARRGRACARSAPAAITLAEAEGFDAHARSVAIRLNL